MMSGVTNHHSPRRRVVLLAATLLTLTLQLGFVLVLDQWTSEAGEHHGPHLLWRFRRHHEDGSGKEPSNPSQHRQQQQHQHQNERVSEQEAIQGVSRVEVEAEVQQLLEISKAKVAKLQEEQQARQQQQKKQHARYNHYKDDDNDDDGKNDDENGDENGDEKDDDDDDDNIITKRRIIPRRRQVYDDDYSGDDMPPGMEYTRLYPTDAIMQWGWNTAPIVVEEYKLLFFTVPKISCTVFKMLFRRMMGHKDWKSEFGVDLHSPYTNGLKYLNYYPPHKAQQMMTSKYWTRAIFLREPKERLLSIYLDKVVNRDDVSWRCCATDTNDYKNISSASDTDTNTNTNNTTNSTNPHTSNNNTTSADYAQCQRQLKPFPGFVQIAKTSCHDEHWAPLSHRIDEKYWPWINFYGRFETVAADTERLLRRLRSHREEDDDGGGGGGDTTAWDLYGANGWGENGTEAIFHSASTLHATGAAKLVPFYYSDELIREVESMYKEDYDRFGFVRRGGVNVGGVHGWVGIGDGNVGE